MDSLHQDKSGYICSKEFGSLLRTLGYNPTEAEVNTLMAKVDVDHNGKVFVYLVLGKGSKKKKKLGIFPLRGGGLPFSPFFHTFFIFF